MSEMMDIVYKSDRVRTVEPFFIETSTTEIKKEDITEEDPLSDSVPKDEIDTEQMMLKEEFEDEDCDLVTKIEILDDMLLLTKSENSDLQSLI